MTSRFADHILGPDTHANRPAAGSTPKRALYECTTHGKIYYNDGAAWQDWATLGVTTTVATDTIWDTKGDMVAASGADAASKLAVGSNGQVLTADSTQTLGVKWATPSGGGGSGWGQPYPVDLPPVTPNAHDDEFDGTSTATWAATPSAATSATVNPTLAPSMLEIVQSGSANFQGLVQAVPGAYPYTITACLAYTDMLGANDRGGMLILGPTGPSGASLCAVAGRAGQVGFAGIFKFDGTFQSVAGVQPPSYNRLYMRIRVNSATSIDSWINEDGSGWVPRHVAFNPGFTPGVMGVAGSRGSGTYGSRAYFDWFRVT